MSNTINILHGCYTRLQVAAQWVDCKNSVQYRLSVSKSLSFSLSLTSGRRLVPGDGADTEEVPTDADPSRTCTTWPSWMSSWCNSLWSLVMHSCTHIKPHLSCTHTHYINTRSHVPVAPGCYGGPVDITACSPLSHTALHTSITPVLYTYLYII